MTRPTNEVSDSDPLYQAALAVEQDEALAAEMTQWERAMLGDGIKCDSKSGLRLPRPLQSQYLAKITKDPEKSPVRVSGEPGPVPRDIRTSPGSLGRYGSRCSLSSPEATRGQRRDRPR